MSQRKWMGSTITAITFPYFLMDKERYNLLDYFRMGIIEEIDSFSLTWKTLPVISNYVRNDAKIWKKRCVDCEEKEFKIYIRHSQKKLRPYICAPLRITGNGKKSVLVQKIQGHKLSKASVNCSMWVVYWGLLNWFSRGLLNILLILGLHHRCFPENFRKIFLSNGRLLLTFNIYKVLISKKGKL